MINGHGAIIGTVREGARTVGAFWRAGGLTHLPPLPLFEDGVTTSINDDGQIVGYCRSGDGKQTRACIWHGQDVRPLLIVGWPNTMALAINGRGQILIQAYADELKPAYFLWTDGKAEPLPGNPAPVSLNDSGQVLLSGPGAAVWQSGKTTVLGGLPGGVQSFAAAINNKGWTVGSNSSPMEATSGKAYTPAPDRNFGGGMFSYSCACLWQHGMVMALSPLPGDGTSEALGLNVLGSVVGDSGRIEGDMASARVTHAVIWINGAVADLQKRVTSAEGWKLARANGINDSGQIIGRGYVRNGYGGYESTGFLLTPAFTKGQ